LKATVLKPGEKLKLAVVHKGDAYGTGLADALFSSIRYNDATAAANGANYQSIDYGNTDAPDAATKYANAVDAIVAYQPHVVIVIGTSEGVTQVFGPLENKWPSTVAYKPHYILTDGTQIPELWPIVGTDADRRKRIVGTVPGSTAPDFTKFQKDYRARISDGTTPDQYTAAAYDAGYLLMYALAGIGDSFPSGPNMVLGLDRVVPPGTLIEVGAGQIGAAFTILSGPPKDHINYQGASGPLDFDITTGEAESDIQIWCVQADASGKASAFVNSGCYYDAATKTLQNIDAAVCP
jgi:branched-chain amino acid transport system substrate-binding protein